MSKRVIINNHDLELIQWLVNFYKDNSPNAYVPAHQNLNELIAKLSPVSKDEESQS